MKTPMSAISWLGHAAHRNTTDVIVRVLLNVLTDHRSIHDPDGDIVHIDFCLATSRAREIAKATVPALLAA